MSADGKVSRRSLLTQAGALGAWLPFGPLDATGDVGGARPPGFPEGIEVYRQGFRNWAGDIRLDAVPTCAPRSAEEVVQIVNWASQSGYRIRPRGMAHNWSPLTLSDATGEPQRLVLLDTTKHLRQVSTGRSGGLACVRAQSGVTMSVLLSRLEASGLGMTATPAPGDLTLGGVLAVDGHGTGVPAQGSYALRVTPTGR